MAKINLKSRKTAIAFTAVAVVASTVLGSHRSLAALRRGVEKTAFSGADGSGYSIAGDMQEICNIAHNLHTVGKKYLPENDKRLADLLMAVEDVETDRDWMLAKRPVADRKIALAELTACCDVVQMALKDVGVSEADSAYLAGFEVDLDSYLDTISRDPYNQLARQFNEETLDKFPANVLGFLTGIRPLETFD